MDKLVDDGYTMNANRAGGHLRWSIGAMLFYATIPDRPETHSRGGSRLSCFVCEC
jgi:hypothetical protein